MLLHYRVGMLKLRAWFWLSERELVSQLVGALSPVNHKGILYGWTYTSLYLQVINFTSHHTTSQDFFFSLFIFRGHSTGEPASNRVTYSILRADTGKHGEKIGRGFGKNAGEWTARVRISKEESPAVSVARMAIYWPTPGFKDRTCKLCVLTRWDFNFCIRSSPLQGRFSECQPRNKIWPPERDWCVL